MIEKVYPSSSLQPQISPLFSPCIFPSSVGFLVFQMCPVLISFCAQALSSLWVIHSHQGWSEKPKVLGCLLAHYSVSFTLEVELYVKQHSEAGRSRDSRGHRNEAHWDFGQHLKFKVPHSIYETNVEVGILGYSAEHDGNWLNIEPQGDITER